MTGSPFSGSSSDGTAERGARSDDVRIKEGRPCCWDWDGTASRAWKCVVGAWPRGGELDMMPVLEVGTGVGYLR